MLRNLHRTVIHAPVSKARRKTQITIRLDESSINGFKTMSTEVDVPYPTLINIYLRDCAR